MKHRYYLAGVVTYSRHRERLGLWAIADVANNDRIVSHQGTRERAVQWCETMNQQTKRQAKDDNSMTPFLNGTPEEINQSMRKFHELGLLTILEEDAERGFRIEFGPELRKWMEASAVTKTELLARSQEMIALRQQGLITAQDALRYLFEPLMRTKG